MSFRGAYYVLILMLTMRPAMGDELVTIRLNGEVLIMTRTYRLLDIVDPASIDTPLKKQMSMVEIGRTPRPGQLTQVTRFELNAILENAIPGITRRLRWEGSAFVRVRGGGTTCDAETLQQSAQRLLLAWLHQNYGKGSARRVGELKPVMVPEGDVTFSPKLPAVSRLSKRMPVWVDVLVDGNHFQTVPVWFEVSVQAPVQVATNTMERYKELSSQDVVEKLWDIACLNDEPLKKSELPGKRLVQGLKAGAVITARDVEPIPSVRQGEFITVYAHQGSVYLSVKGIALSDGHVEEQIIVQNPGNGESYRATIIGKSQAKVN